MDPRIVSRDGQPFAVRPVGAGDRHAVADLFSRMSAESRRRRYLATKPRLTEFDLTYLTALDHRSHDAIAAVDEDGRFVAIARYATNISLPSRAEVAVEVADEHHGRGIGPALVSMLLERARANGFVRLTATLLWENAPARSLFQRLGFQVRGAGLGLIDLELDLAAVPDAGPRMAPAA